MHSIFNSNLHICLILLLASTFSLSGQLSVEKHDSVFIKKLSINSSNNDYAPVLNNGKLYFVSDRPLKVGNLVWNMDDGTPTNIFKSSQIDSLRFSKPEPVNEINTIYNEGPVSFSTQELFYTSNSKNTKKKNTGTYSYRLFYVTTDRGLPTGNPIEIPFKNSDSVSIMHPTFVTDSLIYFTLVKKNTMSGSDIYYSNKKNKIWSEPVKCGAPINSEKDDCFPSFYNGNLYFSSNRDGGKGMLDLYYVSLQDTGQKINTLTILNSENDELGICFKNPKEGYFSSNRLGNDDLFYFRLSENPVFNPCEKQVLNTYCYNFKEKTDYETKDTINMIYEWDFGDGSKARGLVVDHCFPGEGNYAIKLNVIQKSDNAIFDTELSYDLDIKNIEQLYIISHDTLALNESATFDSEYGYIKNFVPQKYFWKIDDSDRYFEGKGFNYIFKKEGTYNIKLLITGLENSIPSTHCVYKTVRVIDGFKNKTMTRMPFIKRKNDD